MTNKSKRMDRQWAHLNRKFMNNLKRELQLNERMRRMGQLPRLDPKRLP